MRIQETEAKILDIDPTAIESRLRELGAKPVFAGQLEATFFDFPDQRLATQGSYLRLRREGDTVRLTCKLRQHEDGAKVRDELEVAVDDAAGCTALLQALGLVITNRVIKQRRSWQLGTARCEIDCYEGNLSFIPPLLEIEAPTIADVRNTAWLLGFAAEQLKPWGLAELIEHYRRS